MKTAPSATRSPRVAAATLSPRSAPTAARSLAVAAAFAAAASLPATAIAQADAMSSSVSVSGLATFNSNLDGNGGSFDWSGAIASGSLKRQLSPEWSIGFNVGYQYERWSFSSPSAFGSQAPWGTINRPSVGFNLGYQARPDVGPYFFEPTVLTGVTDEMVLCGEETFGPVVSVYPVASDEVAVERANDSAYGLNAVIVTRDKTAGRTIAARVHAGTVNVNEAFGPSWGSTRSPMGGMGDSGLGRRHGDEGLLKYTESQTIATQRFLGFDAQFGMTDEKWLNTLAGALSVMKKVGIK